jgi:hypothetical protein
MNIRLITRLGAVALFSLSLATVASAQATRTWVSGVGDDVNPCSRTAPCKTFAGAISKTASGGEIDVIDPGGFGTVTITKPITIDGQPVEAGILASGVVGVTVNIASPIATSVVNLRNLEINGAGTTLGTNGINFVSGSGLNLDNVAIWNFTNRALNVTATTPANFTISHCHFWNLQATAVALVPASTTAHRMVISKSNISNNGVTAGSAGGVFAQSGGKVTIEDSVISGNTASGIESSTGAEIFVDNSVLSYNQFGVRTSGGTLWLSRSTIHGSTGGSAVSNIGGTLNTFGDNRMAGNGVNNTGTLASPALQ